MKNYILVVFVLVVVMFLYCTCKSAFGGKSKHESKSSIFSDTDLTPSLSLVQELYFTKFNKRFIKNSNKASIRGVDMVYVIAMPQRKQYITEQINDLGVLCKYFDAVKPSDLSTNEYDILSSINDPRSDIYKKYTRLPVLLSFIMCFIDAIQNEYSTIIVFEDDIKLNVSKTMLYDGIHEFIKSSMEFFYMGYCYLNCNQLLPLHDYKYIVEAKDHNLLCCHALCIKTRTGTLLDLIKYCFPMNKNSDELFRDYFIIKNVKVCVPRTVYFVQNRNTVESLNESYDAELKTCTF
jgi:hypothetical protein